MSALAGVIEWTGPSRPDVVVAMLGTMPHRGIEVSIVELGSAAIGVASRPAPFSASTASNDRFAAAVSGAVDNLADLGSLAASGVPAGLQAADVLVALLDGGFAVEDIASRMRGTFSAVVTDGAALWAFRDHIGFAPMFFAERDSGTLVATEAKAVAAGAGLPREPALDVVEHIFFGTLGPETHAALRGTQRLPAATVLEARGSKVAMTAYWDPESLLETARLSHEEIHERFEELMKQAVARTLTGNDIVSFSGGYDSPAVAAYAAPMVFEATGKPLAGLSLIYPELPTVDERQYIEPAAAEIGLDPLHLYSQIAGPLDDIAEWVGRFDGPVSVISLAENFSHLSKARELGYSSMLTGDFAEFVADERHHLLEHLITHGHLVTAFRQVRTQVNLGVPIPRAMRPVARALTPLPVRRWLKSRRGHQYTAPAWVDRRRLTQPELRSSRSAWRREQLNPFIGPGLSLESDNFIQEYAGVQTRRPFADVDLWEFFLSLPAHHKFPDFGRKYLLRDLLRGTVPDLILDRTTKTVFDDSILARIDYPSLRHLIFDSHHRISGVDYDALKGHLDREDLDIVGFMWAKDLAGIHAFLALFD